MKKQATWVDRIVHSMTEQQAAIGRLFSDDMPQWAIRMFVEVTKVLGPGTQDGSRQKSEAYSIGALAGHQEKLYCKDHPFAQEFEKVAPKQLTRLLGLTASGRKQMSDRIDHALCLARKQTAEEKAEFFRGYSDALNAKLIAEDGHLFREKSDKTHAIYLLMAINWRSVDRFRNRGELRRWLVRQRKEYAGISLDTLKKLCDRHGYNPGAKAGRPAESGDTE